MENDLMLDEFIFLLPQTFFKQKNWEKYAEETFNGQRSRLKKDEFSGDYKAYEALTIDGKDVYFIASIYNGAFFIESITKHFAAEQWYSWYSEEEVGRIFKKLGKSIFDFMGMDKEERF